MQVYNVGPDELYDLPSVNVQKWAWLVYWYQELSYEGDGEAVALCKIDNCLYVKHLGHGSDTDPMCGTMEDADRAVSVEDFLAHKDNIHDYDARQEVKDKVIELLELTN